MTDDVETITAEPRSDQWNADDFIGGARTFTIASVKTGSAEQKYDIELIEGEGRVWRPPLTVLRLLMAAWGDKARAWKGHRVRLYRDDSVTFGRDTVGGIRVSHLSDLPDGKPLTVSVTTKRGKRATFTVEPLPDDTPAVPTLNERITTALAKFSEIGISLAQLEAERGRASADWNDDDLQQLVVTFQSISRGEVRAGDVFPAGDDEEAVEEPEGWEK